jgi:hypothetical protein
MFLFMTGCSSMPKPGQQFVRSPSTNEGPLTATTTAVRRVKIVGDWFYLDGSPLLIKGCSYEYHPVGKNPGDVQPPPQVFRRQIRELKQAGFNAIRWFHPTPRILKICEQENMLVFVQFQIDQNGDFFDTKFRADTIAGLREIVRETRGCANIAGYLVMNEPYLHIVSSAREIEATMSLLSEVRDMVKKEDPGAYVSFDSWPSLAWLDYSSWDFICFNVYPWSSVITSNHGMGYRPFLDYLKKTLAPGKPLVIMEYGASVGPYDVSGYGYGGYTEEQQASESIQMLRDILATGAAGASYAHFADPIWKVGSNAEQDDDPEEWFGMLALDMKGGPEMEGRLRPVYYAHRDFYRAVLIEPGPCSTVSGVQRIFLNSENAKEVRYRMDDGRWQKLERGHGSSWMGHINTTTLTDGLHHVEISAEGTWDGKVPLDAWIVVANRENDPFALDVRIIPSRRSVQPDEPLSATISVHHLDGTPATNVTVNWATHEHRYWNFEPQTAVTGPEGTVTVNVEIPREPGWITISAGVDAAHGPYQRRFGGLATVAVGTK